MWLLHDWQSLHTIYTQIEFAWDREITRRGQRPRPAFMPFVSTTMYSNVNPLVLTSLEPGLHSSWLEFSCLALGWIHSPSLDLPWLHLAYIHLSCLLPTSLHLTWPSMSWIHWHLQRDGEITRRGQGPRPALMPFVGKQCTTVYSITTSHEKNIVQQKYLWKNH